MENRRESLPSGGVSPGIIGVRSLLAVTPVTCNSVPLTHPESMKKLIIAAAVLGTLGIAACGGDEKKDDAKKTGDKTEKAE